MSGRLAGKVCIITGTGGSQGRAAAVRFAQEGVLLVSFGVAAAGALLTRGLSTQQRPEFEKGT